ncbi:MAG TPA: Ran-binding zinc finger domain-containing protein [Actinomycetota bacterium]|nr:Ran-binding zinc finger domain-containing protein [Actinomycetota bacterium]
MISTDLFQTIALGLMLVILIALVALLAAINGLKKLLESPTSHADAPSAYADTTSYPTYGETSIADTGSTYASESSLAQPQPAPRQEVATSYVPLSQAAEPAPQAAATSSAAPALTGNEPEEQPFERDGRWWFKRGGDLLVYDEGTGQWVAAGTAAATSSGTQTTAPEAATTTTTQTAGASAEVGEGWRCSSCGAINGSTATVCRMCFTPR